MSEIKDMAGVEAEMKRLWDMLDEKDRALTPNRFMTGRTARMNLARYRHPYYRKGTMPARKYHFIPRAWEWSRAWLRARG